LRGMKEWAGGVSIDRTRGEKYQGLTVSICVPSLCVCVCCNVIEGGSDCAYPQKPRFAEFVSGNIAFVFVVVSVILSNNSRPPQPHCSVKQPWAASATSFPMAATYSDGTRIWKAPHP
jgi:hypothetical protein